MPFRAKLIDRNQPEIVKALRKAGATVQVLSAIGQGVPDLLVGYRGRNRLLEVKDGLARKQDRQLTPRQVEWHREWRGEIAVVESVEQALAVLEGMA